MSETQANGDQAVNPNYGSGYLEISEKGFGFLRTAQNHFHPKPTDIFVTPDTIRRSFLREGSYIEGPTQPPHRGTSPQLKGVDKVNEMPFQEYTKAVRFENLTSIDPIDKFKLETTPDLDESLFDAGYLDSFALADMVTEVEREFKVRIPDADLTPRRFESLARIGEYLSSRGA